MSAGTAALPIRIHSQVRLGVTPEINAVCAPFIAAVAVFVLAASIVAKRQEFAREVAARAM